jgi:hypothetical protein
LELSRFETITFSDATLSDINVALCYVLSQYYPRIFPVSLYQRVDIVLGFGSREGDKLACGSVRGPNSDEGTDTVVL